MKLFTRKEVKEGMQSNLDTLLSKEAEAAKQLAEKIKRINNVDTEYSVKVKYWEDALKKARFEHDVFLKGQLQTLDILEARRKAALEPIDKEKQELSAMKEQIAQDDLHLKEESSNLLKRRHELGELEAKVNVAISEVDNMRRDVLTLIEQRQKEAQAAEKYAKEALMALVGEQERAKVALTELTVKEQSMAKAEMSVKAAMVAVDKRLEKEKREQKLADDKRRSLALAIAELKKRGLWHKAQEMKTK